MLQNYFRIAWRNLWKNRFFSLVNIFGLAVGFAFTLLIGAYVWSELQVNLQLRDANNQYIILSKWKDPNLGYEIGGIAELPKAMAENYPDLVRNYYHADLATTIVARGETHYRESIQTGDSTLLHMYGFKLLYGDVKTALNNPFSVVITQHAALKYFGKKDVVGQALNFESMQGKKHDFIVSGVLADIAANSITHLDGHNRTGSTNSTGFFFSADAAKFFKRNLNGWDNTGTVDYLELQNGVDPKVVDKAMLALMRKFETDDVIRNSLTPYLVSLKDYNLVGSGGLVKKMIRTLSCIALFILLMAVINFVNICIGRSSGRMREIGIRKVLGSLRRQLVWQFLSESTIVAMLATVFALMIYVIGRSYLSAVLDWEIPGLFSLPIYLIPVPILLALLVGMISGIYPALVLSALKAVDSLKGKLASVKDNVLLRKTLVTFQFATATVVFIGTVIIWQQLNLFFNGNLGYNKDYLLYAQLPRDWSPQGVRKMESIRDQLALMPQIRNISLSFEIPDGANSGNFLNYRQGASPGQAVSAEGLFTDDQYASTYGIPVKSGTFFKSVYAAADSDKIVINETEARAMGWKTPQGAIGQKIFIPAYNNIKPFTVRGVIADFHFGSMQEKIMPEIFINVNSAAAYRYFTIRLRPGNMQENIAALERKWTQLMPGAPFEYHFMDEALTRVYQSELQLKRAANVATFLAITIVLLGVLGLISLSIQKRTKEIGIRKVLGSSVAGIMILFLKDFLGVASIAGLVACPLAFYLMQNWLNAYAYKIKLSPYPFVISIVVLTSITALLIVLQTIKAAFSNPVNSLKDQ